MKNSRNSCSVATCVLVSHEGVTHYKKSLYPNALDTQHGQKFKKSIDKNRILNKWYARVCWLYKGLETIYIHVCINIPMFNVL